MWRICIPNTSKKRLVVGGGGGVMYVGWSLGSLENQPPMFEMEPSGGR